MRRGSDLRVNWGAVTAIATVLLVIVGVAAILVERRANPPDEIAAEATPSEVPASERDTTAQLGPTGQPRDASSADGGSPDPTSGADNRGSAAATEADFDDSTIYRQTGEVPVVVAGGANIDLDSPESDWGVRTSNDHDFGPSGAVLSIGRRDSEVKFALVKDQPTVEDCQSQTVFDNFVDIPQTVVGQRMCVWSSQGRVAYVEIADIDKENDTMSFDIVVWKLETDP